MNRILAISALLVLYASTYARAASVFTLPSGVRVEIVESSFEKNEFRVLGCKGGESVCRINGHVPFGITGDLPNTYVKSITVTYHGKSYSLDASDMYDAWGSRPLEVKGTVRYFGGRCSDEKNCEFRGIFSDGVGTFVAEWRVVDGVPMRDVLTDSSDIVDLFIHHIDPPENE